MRSFPIHILDYSYKIDILHGIYIFIVIVPIYYSYLLYLSRHDISMADDLNPVETSPFSDTLPYSIARIRAQYGDVYTPSSSCSSPTSRSIPCRVPIAHISPRVYTPRTYRQMMSTATAAYNVGMHEAMNILEIDVNQIQELPTRYSSSARATPSGGTHSVGVQSTTTTHNPSYRGLFSSCSSYFIYSFFFWNFPNDSNNTTVF